jgi:ADP-ribose pyrophosphatase YjhB (NUDIX family)
MKEPGIAVKAYIVSAGKLLVLKRIPNDDHYAGKWDIPGGRLKVGEDPMDGLKRETKEETGLEIEILLPIDVQHFTRDDGQITTMVIFLCKPLTKKVKLSEEHTEYSWIGINDIASHPVWLATTTEKFFKYGLDKFVS